MRQIIFDTETTGYTKGGKNVAEGHRIIEIGCIELIDRQATGKTLHFYFNPEQEIDAEASAVHGLDNQRLKNEPTFSEKWAEIAAFLQGADDLIAHNASFDCQFLNHEMTKMGIDWKLEDKFNIIDTLALAQQQFPAQRNSLDALCKRFNVDNSSREKHGALLDSELLLEVYLKLTGGQSALFESAKAQKAVKSHKSVKNKAPQTSLNWLAAQASAEEISAHQAIMEKIRR